MAKRKPRGKKRQTSLGDLLQPFLRGEVLGVALLVLGLVTLLALISWSRGTVTEWWVSALRRLVGVGVYGVPAALGAGGVWLILRGLGREPQVRGGTVAGIATLAALLLTLIHLLWPLPAPQTPESLLALAQEGKGGGYLGGVLARALWVTLGFWGSCIVLAFFLLANLLWLGQVSLADLLRVAQEVVDEVRRRMDRLPKDWVQGPLPGMEGNGLHPTLQRALEPAPPPPAEPGRSAVLLNGATPRR
ncbi:MAG: DNA translocase FtsK 4TM domain-containing protein, partial [Anaerolineae bacterium]